MFKVIKKFFVFLRYDPVTILIKLKLTSTSEGQGVALSRKLISYKFRSTGLEELLSLYGKLEQNKSYELFLSGHKKQDALYLYKHAINAENQNILEFGCGISTIVMAYAIKKRKNGSKQKIYSVEADAKWAALVQKAMIDLQLSDYCEIMISTPTLSTFNGQVCSFFEKLPDINPGLIYLDGPDPRSVIGNVNGLTMNAIKYMVQADILLYEWGFYAGTKIIIDGRLHNLRFLEKNLKRKYRIKRNYFTNVSTIELIR